MARAPRHLSIVAVCAIALIAVAATLACAPYLPAPPQGRGYTYGRVGVPYRAERRGDTLGGAYRRAFATIPDGPAPTDPGPLVGGAPTGFVYNAHLGDAGEALEPSATVEEPAGQTPDAGAAAPEGGAGEADGGGAADGGGQP